jgi:MFS family permease
MFTSKALTVCVLASIFYCYEYFLRVMPSVMSTDLMLSYNISHIGLGILSACFYYAYMPLQIPVGIMMDKFGPRIVLTFACLLCVIGTYLFGCTNYIAIAQTGRFLVGFGSAFAFVGVLKIAAIWLPAKFYAMMVGFCMFLGMVGAMGGEIILAKVMEYFAWGPIVNMSAIVGLGLAPLLWFFIRDYPEKIQSHKTEFPQENFLPSLIAIAKSSNVWLVGFIGCFTFLPLSSFAEMWAIPYFEAIGYEKTAAAYSSAMVFLGFGLGAPLWGLLSDYMHSRKKPLLIGSILAAACASYIILFPHASTNYMFIALFGCGFFTSVEILVFAVGNDAVTKDISGSTVAIINMIVMLGGVVLQPVIGGILDFLIAYNGVYRERMPIVNYQIALAILPIGLFVASGLILFLKESYRD